MIRGKIAACAGVAIDQVQQIIYVPENNNSSNGTDIINGNDHDNRILYQIAPNSSYDIVVKINNTPTAQLKEVYVD